MHRRSYLTSEHLPWHRWQVTRGCHTWKDSIRSGRAPKRLSQPTDPRGEPPLTDDGRSSPYRTGCVRPDSQHFQKPQDAIKNVLQIPAIQPCGVAPGSQRPSQGPACLSNPIKRVPTSTADWVRPTRGIDGRQKTEKQQRGEKASDGRGDSNIARR